MKIILIHGAWHEGSLLENVAVPLRQAGHEVHTPTLAGNGAGDIDRTIGLQEAIQSAVDYINNNNLSDVVLVGHSYGGMILTGLADIIPDKIRRLVYWNAFVPMDGESLYDLIPPHYRDMMDGIAASGEFGPGGVALPFPVWREAFMNDADLELAEKSFKMLSPQPIKTFTDKISLKSNLAMLPTPARSYINCLDDISLPKGELSWMPRFLNRLGLCRLIQMPGGHEVCFTNPKLLAGKINEAARD